MKLKRIVFLAAITGLLLASSGCSTNNGLLGTGLGGGLSSGCNNCAGSGLFGGSTLSTNFLKDGPVRKWLRGDACDSCNVPAGQLTYDSGFDATCDACGGGVPSPAISAPSTNFYPSYDETSYGDTSYGDTSYGDTSYGGTSYGEPVYNAPTYGSPSYGESLPTLPSIGPIGGSGGLGGISESQFFGGASDNIELPPLSGN